MASKIKSENLQKIAAGIHKKFTQVAVSPEGQFKYPTGKNGLTRLKKLVSTAHQRRGAFFSALRIHPEGNVAHDDYYIKISFR